MLLGRGGKILKHSLKESLDEAVLKRLNLNSHLSEPRSKISIQMLCLNLRTQMLTARLLLVPPGGVIDERGFHLRIAPADHFCPCGNWFSLTIVWVQGTELELLGG